jgi:hypothetical protein
MRLFFLSFLIGIVLTLAPAAAGAELATVALAPERAALTDARTTITVAIVATCATFDSAPITAVVYVTVGQTTGNILASDTGYTDIVCDGTEHVYLVSVPTDGQRFHGGPATATAKATVEGFIGGEYVYDQDETAGEIQIQPSR